MADNDLTMTIGADFSKLTADTSTAFASLKASTEAAGNSVNQLGEAVEDLSARHLMHLTNSTVELGRAMTEGGASLRTFESVLIHISTMAAEGGGFAELGKGIVNFLLNPMTLATAAVLAVVEAVGVLFKEWDGGAPKTEQDLKTANDLIKEIAKDWQGAADAVKQYGKETQTVRTFEINTQIATLTADLQSQLKGIGDTLTDSVGGFFDQYLGGADLGPFQAIVDKLKASLESGVTPDLTAVHEEIAALANTNPANAALQEIAQQLTKLTDAAEKTEVAIKKMKAELTQAPDLHAMDVMRQAMAGSTVSGVDFAGRFGDDPTVKQADQARAALLAEMQTKLQVDDIEIGSEKTKIDSELTLGQISVSQKFAQLQDLADKKYSLDRQELKAELSIGNLSVQQHQAIIDKLKILDAQYAANKEALVEQAAEAERQAQEKQVTEAKTVADAILSVWNSQLTAVLQGTESWGEAFSKMCGDMLLKFLEMAEQIAVEWAVLSAMTGLGLVSGPMPSIGSIAKGVLGFHADGAYNVPQTELAILHPGEMVLDSTSAGITRGMMDGSGSGGLGGTTINVNAPLTVQALDQTGMTAVLQRHATTIAAAVAQVMNQNPSLRPSY